MKGFLRKLKLIGDFSTEIKMEKAAFVNKFKNHVDEGDTGFFPDTLDAFSSSKNEFKGHVGLDYFKIKRRRRFFDMNMNFAIASGSYKQKGESLIIDAEINGFSGIMVPFYLFTIVFYVMFISAFFLADKIEGNGAGFALPFIIIHAAFMFGIPYFMMRRSVTRMKRELEREFYYMTK
jgi:hypothetical protein